MRDDFDITLERKLESNAGEAGRAVADRRDERTYFRIRHAIVVT